MKTAMKTQMQGGSKIVVIVGAVLSFLPLNLGANGFTRVSKHGSAYSQYLSSINE